MMSEQQITKMANFISATVASQTITINNGKDPIVCAVCKRGSWDGCQCPLTKEQVLALTSDDFGEEVLTRFPAIVFTFRNRETIIIPIMEY